MATAYFKQVFVAADQLLNATFGGWADETFSSRCYRCYPRAASLIDLLLWFDKNHCERSYESEAKRAYLPPELRGTPT